MYLYMYFYRLAVNKSCSEIARISLAMYLHFF